MEKWPAPIYSPEDQETCPLCLDKLIRPEQIQCAHVMCNPSMQNVLSLADSPQCPVCRAEVIEYRTLFNSRIRSSRDKTIPLNFDEKDDSEDEDYVPPTKTLTAAGESGEAVAQPKEEGQAPYNQPSRMASYQAPQDRQV